VTVSGANTHDKRLVEKTLESLPIERSEPTEESPQNISLDKGYDFADVRELVDQWGYTAHIPRRGEDQWKRQDPGVPGEEMDRRENPLVDEQVQAAVD
jgi:putative transposase